VLHYNIFIMDIVINFIDYSIHLDKQLPVVVSISCFATMHLKG
jgi:hypothetical protein